MCWVVNFSNAGRKGAERLPEKALRIMAALIVDLRISGPVRANWPNYSKIAGHKFCHHCHLLRGRPTYVAVWREEVEENSIEVIYVGSHESANYGRTCKS